ncbi:MAG: stage II sporulation protein M [Hungatella sp.]
MMKIRRNSYEDRLFFCFLGGILGGTVLANLLSGELRNQIGYFDALFLTETPLTWEEKQRLCGFVFRQRLLETALAWLIGLTVMAAPVFHLLTFCMGGSMAVLISVITFEKGVFGLPFYVATMLPQIVPYMVLFLVLASWAGETSHPIRPRASMLLLALVAMGAVFEVYLNPYFLKIF